ncbi:MAG: glucan biosynthesis protein [Desulfobacterales bacterium]
MNHRRFGLHWLHRLLFVAILLSAASIVGASGSPSLPEGSTVFDYAWLKGHARELASRPYVDHEGEIPRAVRDLSWDDYQMLTFNREHALWSGEASSLFRAEFFHLGLFFKTPVIIYELVDGRTGQIPYEPEMFDYGRSGLNAQDLPEDLGFAGFRFFYHTDWRRDVVAFLGHSYFRAVGREMQYGISARGLAIDTALPRPEEFPRFSHFWLEKPKPGSDTATVYALLDSPSATGAYRFDIRPGDITTMKVDAAIYPRKSIERLGVAPLTSMYMVGENSRRAGWDWRPEIHDSDGLAILTGHGEWIWRPLANPRHLRFNAYADTSPKGFGLIQRDRAFDHYQDDGVYYDKRPSLWVEPMNDWREGSVQLFEIPTQDETFDNVVAYWNPAQPVRAGEELLFSYRLHWGSPTPTPPGLALVVDTFTGLGGVVGRKREYYSKRFVVDFKGGKLPMLGKDVDVRPVISTSAGKVELTSARPQEPIGGYRAMFDVVPPDDGEAPINLKLYLEANGQPLTETWVYQWSPPPAEERKLRNP